MGERACAGCGGPVSVDAAFCPRCGTAVPTVSSPGASTVPPQAASSRRPRGVLASAWGVGCLTLVALWLLISLGIFGYEQYREHQKKQWWVRVERSFAPLAGEWVVAAGDGLDRLSQGQRRFTLELADNSGNTHLEGEPARVLKAVSRDPYLVITFKNAVGTHLAGIAMYPDRVMGEGGFADVDATVSPAGDELQVRLADRTSSVESRLVLERAGAGSTAEAQGEGSERR